MLRSHLISCVILFEKAPATRTTDIVVGAASRNESLIVFIFLDESQRGQSHQIARPRPQHQNISFNAN